MFADNLNRMAAFGRYTEEVRDRLWLSGLQSYRCDALYAIFQQQVVYETIPQWNLEKSLCLRLVIDHTERCGHVALGIDIGDGFEPVLTMKDRDSLADWVIAVRDDKAAQMGAQGFSRFFYEAVHRHKDKFQQLIMSAKLLEQFLSMSTEELETHWSAAASQRT